jgi:hypothetical protein
VAFVRNYGPPVDGTSPSLWTIGIDGRDLHELVGDEIPFVRPAEWSPDGSTLVYGEGLGSLTFVDAQDGSIRRIPVPGLDWIDGLAWSPDGRWIVVAGGEDAPGVADLWLVLPDGTDVHRLTDTPQVEEAQPAPSPDGSWIAFVTSDGIERIPADGGPGETVVPTPPDAALSDPGWSPDGTFLTFVVSTETTSTVYALPEGGSDAFPIAPGTASAWQQVPEPTPSPTGDLNELGLTFPVCNVSTMPIAVAGGTGVAAVFADASGGCPGHGEGAWLVGVDVDADGALDATAPTDLDCFFLCEAFAAPDVDADGTSEVAVSTEGADGYGLELFAVSPGAPTIAPIEVDNPGVALRPKDGPFQLAWVGAAAHREWATCDVDLGGVPILILATADVGDTGATITETTVRVAADQATVVDQTAHDVSLIELEQMGRIPPERFCGAPILEEDTPSPTPAPGPEGRDIGLGTNVCQVQRLGGLNLVDDGQPDAAWTGFMVNDAGECPERNIDAQRWIVAIDVTGDGLADASTENPMVNCPYVSCWPVGATDLDADGDEELVVTTGFSIQDQGYFSVSGSGGKVSIAPILVAAPGHPAGGVEPDEPLSTETGGDAGYSAWVRCESYPASPIIVYAWAFADLDEKRDTEWHQVKLNLGNDGVFHVVDATDLWLPPRERPDWILSDGPACGLDLTYA